MLGAMAETHSRALSLLDDLEAQVQAGEGRVKATAVVAALREVRQSLVDLAKLNDSERDRQARTEQTSERPDVDALILDVLAERGIGPGAEPEPQDVQRPEPRALMPGPSVQV